MDGPGSVSVGASTVELNTRGFQFYEGVEPARAIRVRFAGGTSPASAPWMAAILPWPAWNR